MTKELYFRDDSLNVVTQIFFEILSLQGSAFVKDFDKRSRNLNELANERAFVFVFVFVKDGQPTSACVKGYQGVSYWRVR